MGFGGDGTGGGADHEPLCVASDAAEEAASLGGADGFVALAGQHSGLGALVDQVGLGGGQFGLAGSAVEGEVVERLEVCGGDCGAFLGGLFARLCVCWRG